MSRCDTSGTVLVEVLVAALILLIVFTAVVHEISTLAVTRVRIETRDRAVAYASSLHEQMKAAGCGLDVDLVQYVAPVAGDDNDAFKGPWGRVQGCALSAQRRAFESDVDGDDRGPHFWIDGNGNVRLTSSSSGAPDSENEISLETATNFCERFGDEPATLFVDNFAAGPGSNGKCNLGDQTYLYDAATNDQGSSVEFRVSINYWFEHSTENLHPGGSSKCSAVVTEKVAPDLIARRVSITWNDGNGQEREMVMTKRDNVPVDSVEFATGTRIGAYKDGDDPVIMGFRSPVPGDPEYPFYVRRESALGEKCIWFPFLRVRFDNSEREPQFSTSGPLVSNFDTIGQVALENKEIL